MSRYLIFIGSILFLFSHGALALEKAESIEEVRRATAEIGDVTVRHGTLYGKIINKSDVPLKDVTLLVRHIWLWDNEYRPGHDTYSSAEQIMIEGIIAPGERVAFSYTPRLPAVSGGHFETKIIIGAFTELPMVSALR